MVQVVELQMAQLELLAQTAVVAVVQVEHQMLPAQVHQLLQVAQVAQESALFSTRKGNTMATFAVLLGNSVTNIIVADTVEIAEAVTNATCIEYTDENPAGIGWIWDGTTFAQPIVEPTDPTS